LGSHGDYFHSHEYVIVGFGGCGGGRGGGGERVESSWFEQRPILCYAVAATTDTSTAGAAAVVAVVTSPINTTTTVTIDRLDGPYGSPILVGTKAPVILSFRMDPSALRFAAMHAST